jgi:hypothetical protein
MSQKTTPDERFDFGDDDYINELRRRRGTCPEKGILVSFQKKALSDERMAEIATHVRLCGLCQATLRLAERFDACERAVECPEPPHWPEAEQRSREKFHAFPASQRPAPHGHKPAGSFGARLKAIFLRPAFAYLLVAALLYPAYRGLSTKPEVVTQVVKEKEFVQVPRAHAVFGTAQSFELSPADVRAGEETETEIRLAPDHAFFTLHFLAPVRAHPDVQYRIEIRNEQNQAIEDRPVTSQDRFGNFLLVCSQERFPRGSYRLRFKEVTNATDAVTRELEFKFKVW